MKILIDTNFIMTCVKNNIDLEIQADKIIDTKIDWIIPRQVLNELGNLKDKKENKRKDRDTAKLSFEILQKLNPNIIDIGKNPNIDIGIVNYILDKEITLATLDKGLKDRLKTNRILTIKGKNHLEVI